MSNIDDFDTIVGIVFCRLYDHFPIPTTISALSIVQEAMADPTAPSLSDEQFRLEFMAYQKRRGDGEASPKEVEDDKKANTLFDIFKAAMDWLSVEGFLRGNDPTSRQDDSLSSLDYSQIVLTLKGLQTLSLVPTGLQASLGQQMLQAAKEGSKAGLRDLTRKVIGWAVPLGVAALQAWSVKQ